MIKQNKNTPRIALSLYFRINNPEKIPGVYTLLNRLFFQGTLTRNNEQIAQELEENAIELSSDMKQDYIRFRLLCLNEDFNKGLELLEDIIFNSTFDDFDKEIAKLKGEITAELESPKSQAVDNYYKTLYKNHPYGHTYTEILKNLDSISKEDVINAYNNIIKNPSANITVVGDAEEEDIKTLIEKHFKELNNQISASQETKMPVLSESKIVTIEKEDASQAQIIMGWLFPPIINVDYPVIALINTILGAAGLSSRLFLELREKKGLAYVVRSTYDSYHNAASFSVYIATEPKNIYTCIDGFIKEIEKIQNIPVSDKELTDAKKNLLGRRQFFMETNNLQASLTGLFESEGLGYDYEEKLRDAVAKVTSEQISQIAKKYFSSPKVLSILAPKQYLSQLENVIL